ncbi:MAG: ADP-ribosylglycohydrolase family protein [Kiritimatiellae bacterium]|nr:ADP-ribosylglycohydrolase family protein [Kiritimatiellia bacterium]
MTQDKIRGSLIGGAIGDALGYPVEFLYSFASIQSKYGKHGITRLDKKAFEYQGANGKAVVSDDTQMTLFTACGLLNAKRLNQPPLEAIKRAYLEWYETQTRQKTKSCPECWIRNVPELNQRRAPGTTCMSALSEIAEGAPHGNNNSKGCGGVMRVAPIPLFAVVGHRMDILDSDRLAGEAAALTHRHPLGFISAAILAHVIYLLAQEPSPTRQTLEMGIPDALSAMRSLYPQYTRHVEVLDALSKQVISLASKPTPDIENIPILGEGWVGEEALAIALYCSLRHFDSFENAMIAAVNHGGDSDSTGAIAGNILGSVIGYKAIPSFYTDDVELHDLILHIADDLFTGTSSAS